MDENGAQEYGMDFYAQFYSLKGEFCSKHKEIYSSPTVLFVSTESFTENCKQSLFKALNKRLS